MKKILAFILLAVMIFTFSGCKAKDAVFIHDNMSITLTDEFTEAQFEGYDVCFDSANVAVFVIKEEFTILPGAENYTLEQYLDLVMVANKDKNPTSFTKGDLVGFSYTNFITEENCDFTHSAYLYKSADAFWMIQFACKTAEIAKYEPFFEERAKTVTFS